MMDKTRNKAPFCPCLVNNAFNSDLRFLSGAGSSPVDHLTLLKFWGSSILHVQIVYWSLDYLGPRSTVNSNPNFFKKEL